MFGGRSLHGAVLLLGVALLLTSGCALLAPSPLHSSQQVTAWQQENQKLQNWILQGRLIINADGESWQLSLHWQQLGDRFAIMVRAPLGQGSMRISGHPTHCLLETSEGERFEENSAEELLYRQLGWVLPLDALRFWIRGVPASGPFQQQLTDSGEMAQLQQGLWHLELEQYRHLQNYRLPNRIIARSERGTVKLAVTKWQIDINTPLPFYLNEAISPLEADPSAVPAL